jgi:glycosyltransferase involved in cell wall biosynthesis
VPDHARAPEPDNELIVERTGRLAFVPARYGDGVVGGAETVLREVAHGLAGRGWDVDVLTTCARNHFTWTNEFAPGVERDGAVTVRRFPAVVSTPRRERAALNAAIVARQQIDVDAQMRWMNDDVRIPALFDHILEEGDRYRALVFAPYLFWPAFACGQLEPKRSILMPCLHDEPEAHLDIFQDLFASVRGIWFLSDPERELAQRIFTRLSPSEIVGSGVAVPQSYDPERFRRAHGIDGPFVLYAGRREGGKNWERLLAGFAAAVERHPELPLSLVTIGSGTVSPPAAIADRVIDLGFLPEAARDDAFAAADAYVQPSVNESFSRTMIEAWLAGSLVIANGGGAVNRWHCDRSRAGLLYDDDLELAECLRFVAEAPEAAREIAAPGRAYAVEHASWPAVLDRIEATLEAWTAAGEPG